MSKITFDIVKECPDSYYPEVERDFDNYRIYVYDLKNKQLVVNERYYDICLQGIKLEPGSYIFEFAGKVVHTVGYPDNDSTLLYTHFHFLRRGYYSKPLECEDGEPQHITIHFSIIGTAYQCDNPVLNCDKYERNWKLITGAKDEDFQNIKP